MRSDALVFPTVRHSCLPIPETSDLTWEDDEEEEEEEEEEDEDEDADISLEEIPVKQVKRVAPQKQMSIAKVGGKNEVGHQYPSWASHVGHLGQAKASTTGALHLSTGTAQHSVFWLGVLD